MNALTALIICASILGGIAILSYAAYRIVDKLLPVIKCAALSKGAGE